MQNKQKRIFVCSPLKGNIEENQKKAREYSQFVINQGCIPFTPHLFLTLFFNDEVPEEREKARKMALEYLKVCDEVWVFDNKISEGMRNEITMAHFLNKPVKIIGPIAEMAKYCLEVRDNLEKFVTENLDREERADILKKIYANNEYLYGFLEVISPMINTLQFEIKKKGD